jgi:hypothetical protein
MLSFVVAVVVVDCVVSLRVGAVSDSDDVLGVNDGVDALVVVSVVSRMLCVSGVLALLLVLPVLQQCVFALDDVYT